MGKLYDTEERVRDAGIAVGADVGRPAKMFIGSFHPKDIIRCADCFVKLSSGSHVLATILGIAANTAILFGCREANRFWGSQSLLRKTIIAIAVCGFASTVLAQNVAVIEQRQQLYKAQGEATKPMGPMLKGDSPYDAALVKKALQTIADTTSKVGDLFPDDSKTGHDTEALPAIWENKADFIARLKKLNADAQAAEASITDQASFTATMPKLLGECAACHKAYRSK